MSPVVNIWMKVETIALAGVGHEIGDSENIMIPEFDLIGRATKIPGDGH